MFKFFSILFHVIIATIEPMENSDKYVEEHVEHVDPSFTVFDSGTKSLEFLYTTLPSDPTPCKFRSRDYFDY